MHILSLSSLWHSFLVLVGDAVDSSSRPLNRRSSQPSRSPANAIQSPGGGSMSSPAAGRRSSMFTSPSSASSNLPAVSPGNMSPSVAGSSVQSPVSRTLSTKNRSPSLMLQISPSSLNAGELSPASPSMSTLLSPSLGFGRLALRAHIHRVRCLGGTTPQDLLLARKGAGIAGLGTCTLH